MYCIYFIKKVAYRLVIIFRIQMRLVSGIGFH